MGCVCLKCDPSGERFRAEFGRYPWVERRAKRTPGQVLLARRVRQELVQMKKEARARFYGSRRRRKP